MTVFIAVLLTVLTFAFVIYPLLKPRQHTSADSFEDDEELQELHSRRDTTYSMLKELEFDFQSGILTEADYRDMETKYKRKAVSILKGIDGLKKGGAVEEEIERQVQELRRSKGSKDGFCAQCGARRQDDARFCAHCGTRLG